MQTKLRLTSKPLLTIALKILKTIEKPLVPMVGPPKKHSMVMVQLCQNHWKTIDGNGGLKKTLTIPSPWKIEHRWGLYCIHVLNGFVKMNCMLPLKAIKYILLVCNKIKVNGKQLSYILLLFKHTRSYAVLREADLDWIIGPGYSLGGYKKCALSHFMTQNEKVHIFRDLRGVTTDLLDV